MQGTSETANTPHSAPVLSVIGHSGSGKTTLLEKLIRELKRRGYRLAVIKHHHHHGLRLDEPGKDTWRFAQAGADHVVLAGPDRAAHLYTFAEEPSLERLASSIQNVDLILTEGYKHADAPKVEIIRSQIKPGLISEPGDLVAVVSDQRLDLDVPQLGLDDVGQLADLIQARFLKST